MKSHIAWGVLGPGGIANSFVQGVQSFPDATVTAVGSRTYEKGKAFANKYNIPKAYGSYEELVHDPLVDIIYIATPHPMHAENALLALNAGKAVLCEKAFSVNAREAEEVINLARAKKVFLMEAMWTRYLPAIVKVRELLAQKVIGDILQMKVDFGFRAGFEPEGRLLNPALGGGGLLDVGIYTLAFISMVLGSHPKSIVSAAHIGTTGVDEQCMGILEYEGGILASMSAAVRTQTPHEALIIGTEGFIKVPDFWHASSVKIGRAGKPEEELSLPYSSTGYNYEAAEAGRCLRNGLLESPIMPLDETLAIMRIMDTMRAQWNMKYPSDS